MRQDLDRRRPGLDSLRSLAIVGVFLYHAAIVAFFELGIQGKAVAVPSLLGWAGVDLFFVLSGYLITRILLENRESDRFYGVFWARRCLRILPAYFLFLVAALLLAPALAGTKAPGDAAAVPGLAYWLFAANLFMAQAADHGSPPLSVLWSLAIEAQFYLLWPVVVRVLSARALRAVVLAMIALPFPARWLALELGMAELAVHVATPFRLDVLAAGALIALLAAEGRRLPPPWLLFAGFVLAALLFGAEMLSGSAAVYAAPALISLKYSLLTLAFFCLVCLTVASPRADGWFAAVPGLRRLGRISYAVYLWHYLVLLALAGLARQASPGWLAAWPASATYGLLILLGAGATLAVALVSWRLVEAPALALRRHLPYAASAGRRRR